MFGGKWTWIILSAISILNVASGMRNATEIIKRISHLSNRMVRPDWKGDPTIIKVGLSIMNFHPIDEEHMEFSVDVQSRWMWNDPRLQYEDGPPQVTIDAEGATKWFWVPDLHFSNGRGVETHAALKDSIGAWVKSNGDVTLSAKFTVTTHCEMDLHRFPFDEQTCSLMMATYKYTDADLDLRWWFVTVSDRFNSPPAFRLLSFNNTKSQEILATGKYSQLEVAFHIQRLSRHYILVNFLPHGGIVLLSCLIYWLPLVSGLERILFSALLFLSMILLLIANQMGMPKIGYMKAIDVWTLSCMLFLFFNILGVIVLNLLTRGGRGKTHQNHFELRANKEEDGNAGLLKAPSIHSGFVRCLHWVLCIAYPCAFLIFNVIFWCVLL